MDTPAHVFQTGRHYSAHGQRIAYLVRDRVCYFMDVDRGIDGRFIYNNGSRDIRTDELMYVYDHYLFESSIGYSEAAQAIKAELSAAVCPKSPTHGHVRAPLDPQCIHCGARI